jgi:hypothetical protein
MPPWPLNDPFAVAALILLIAALWPDRRRDE